MILDYLSSPVPLAVLAAAVILAWPLGRLLRRGALGVILVLALGLVFAATTTTYLPYYDSGGVHGYLTEFADRAYLVRGFGSTPEKLANIALFVPLGLLGTLMWRRPVLVFAACVTLTFLIEAWQGFIGRGGDAVDVVHNSAGGLIGVLLVRAWTYFTAGDKD